MYIRDNLLNNIVLASCLIVMRGIIGLRRKVDRLRAYRSFFAFALTLLLLDVTNDAMRKVVQLSVRYLSQYQSHILSSASLKSRVILGVSDQNFFSGSRAFLPLEACSSAASLLRLLFRLHWPRYFIA